MVAPNGIGKDAFWANCLNGVSGIKRITLFDTSGYRCHWAGEISDFDPAAHLGSKGLRNLDRTTLLALVAAKLAIEDGALEITDGSRSDIGVILGSTMGSVRSISEFDMDGLRNGPRYVNPAHFPNTVINSPASQVAIRFGLQGMNATISTGFTASLDAIGYAMDMLRLGRVQALLVGGVEELCFQTFLGFYKLGLLATSQDGTLPPFRPFDDRHCGTLLGEGAAFFILESSESAVQRGATIYAELSGYASQFHPDSMYRYDPKAEGLIAVIREALRETGLNPLEIDRVSACANSSKAADLMELTAIRGVFGERQIPLSVPKGLFGEPFSAGGALQLAEMLGILNSRASSRVVAAAHGKSAARGEEGTELLVGERPEKIHALLDGFGPTGVSSALIATHDPGSHNIVMR